MTGRNVTLQVRLTQAEFDLIERLAQVQGTTVSVVARSRLPGLDDPDDMIATIHQLAGRIRAIENTLDTLERREKE